MPHDVVIGKSCTTAGKKCTTAGNVVIAKETDVFFTGGQILNILPEDECECFRPLRELTPGRTG